ncbi:MAG: YCF48-related protein, partial [Pseudomonadota bacterium]
MTRVILKSVMGIGVLSVIVTLCYSMMALGNEKGKERLASDPLYDVCFVESHGYAVGYYGTILYSSDGGETWQSQESGTKELLTAVAFVDVDYGWIVGSQGVILSTSDGGKSWSKQISGTENDLTGVYFLNRMEGWAVGQLHTILRTSDGGKVWEVLSTGEELLLKDVRFLDSKKGFVVGEFGTILFTEDGGVTFKRLKGEEMTLDVEQLEASHPSLNSIDFTNDGSVGIAVGIRGYLLRSSDSGATWEEINSGGGTSLFKVKFIDGCAYAVGLKGMLLSSTDYGSNWLKVSLPPEVGVNWFYGISSSSGEIFLVGE